jgi:hypothetical protein
METAKRRGRGGGVPGSCGVAGAGRSSRGDEAVGRFEASGGLTGSGGFGLAASGVAGRSRATSRTLVGGRRAWSRGAARVAIQTPATAWSARAASSEGQKVDRTCIKV